MARTNIFTPSPLPTVPQGLVLGPLLFSISTIFLGSIYLFTWSLMPLLCWQYPTVPGILVRWTPRSLCRSLLAPLISPLWWRNNTFSKTSPRLNSWSFQSISLSIIPLKSILALHLSNQQDCWGTWMSCLMTSYPLLIILLHIKYTEDQAFPKSICHPTLATGCCYCSSQLLQYSPCWTISKRLQTHTDDPEHSGTPGF